MRNLRLYSTEAAFQSYEESKGGDGVTTQTIVPGVSMSLTPRKRYFNPNDKTILVHTVTINYKDNGGQSIAESETKRFKYIPGVTQEVVITPKNVSGYVMTNELPVVVTIPDDSAITIEYVDERVLEPLTFQITSDGEIKWSALKSNYRCAIEYKKNNGEWVSITAQTGTYAPSIPVSSGDKVQFRGDNSQYNSPNTNFINSFSGTTCGFKISGNIMSLVDSDGFSGTTALPDERTFVGLFNYCTGLTDASGLLLPAATLTNSCYSSMFRSCTSLTTAPELPATSLANYCYSSMFAGCTSLTTAPELPATTLADYCYYYMFQGCTSLTTAPELPATTLVGYCYYAMFQGCTNLNYIKCLATTNVDGVYTENWVSGVAISGTFIRDVNAVNWSFGNSGIPDGWGVMDDRYYEPFTFEILSGGNITFSGSEVKTIYYSKDGGETWNSLTSSSEGSNISVVSGEFVQFKGDNSVYSGTSFSASSCIFNVKGNIMSLVKSNNFVDFTWRYYGVSAYTFYEMFAFCPTIRSAENLILPLGQGGYLVPSNCYNGLFFACTGLTAAPELPSKSGGFRCYTNMFYGCKSLVKAPSVVYITSYEAQCLGMFKECANLVNGPKIINNGTIDKWGCLEMFRDCDKLERVTGSIGNLGPYSYSACTRMFYSCNNLVVTPELPSLTLAQGCYSEMFYYCEKLVKAPELPATNLTESCYHAMFSYCKKLNYIKCLAKTNVTTGNTMNWVHDVATAGTFYKNVSAEDWTIGINGIPSGWLLKDDPFMYPLTFDILTDGEILWKASHSSVTKTISYSKNGGDWTTITSASGGTIPSISVVSGDTIQFKGNNGTYTTSYGQRFNSFSGSTATFNVRGNVMSLVSSENYTSSTIVNEYAFCFMFSYCDGLINAQDLCLPATTLRRGCYTFMFAYSINLITPPSILPAIDVLDSRYGGDVDGCYKSMFKNCTSLTTAPKLPGINLGTNSYADMFSYCTSLTTAPELPATTLAYNCYNAMFRGCTSLTTAPELPATTLASNCYEYMFSNCTSLTTAPELPATTLANYCYSSMFYGCTSLTTAPELPATTLAGYCYQFMFRGCTSLTTAPELPATTLTEWCYAYMFYGCTSLNYIKCLATNISAGDCTLNWVGSVASSGRFVKNPSMSSWPSGVSGIPSGWTVENATL